MHTCTSIPHTHTYIGGSRQEKKRKIFNSSRVRHNSYFQPQCCARIPKNGGIPTRVSPLGAAELKMQVAGIQCHYRGQFLFGSEHFAFYSLLSLAFLLILISRLIDSSFQKYVACFVCRPQPETLETVFPMQEIRYYHLRTQACTHASTQAHFLL